MNDWINKYIQNRMKDLGVMLADYENHRDSMQADTDTSHYDRLVLVGRARICELERLKKHFKQFISQSKEDKT